MHEIDLGDEVKIKVKVGSESYILRAPMQKEVQALGVDENEENFSKFLISIGMPEHVLENLDVVRLKKLANGLAEYFTEKK